jgi:maltose O-acetyltransferase
MIYNWAGIKIGKGSLILGSMEISGQGKPWQKLNIGENCQITSPFYADLNDTITLGNHVAIGHHTVMITMNHDFSCEHKRCGAGSFAPIVIEDGAWLGACVTVLPGVTIGKGSVVAAGAVVNKNVPPNCLVGGIPARVIKSLNQNTEINDSEMSNETAIHKIL